MSAVTGEAVAAAQPNIALVKYWGKRDNALNLPAAGSLSITLDALHTRTTVRFDDTLDTDDISLNGRCDRAQTSNAAAYGLLNVHDDPLAYLR